MRPCPGARLVRPARRTANKEPAMLRILGSAKQLCEGLSRRDMLRVGGLGIGGLSLPQVLALQEASAASPLAADHAFGKAKGLILIHLYGAPSQLEWVDCKP